LVLHLPTVVAYIPMRCSSINELFTSFQTEIGDRKSGWLILGFTKVLFHTFNATLEDSLRQKHPDKFNPSFLKETMIC
jgi:hypothetical protein